MGNILNHPFLWENWIPSICLLLLMALKPVTPKCYPKASLRKTYFEYNWEVTQLEPVVGGISTLRVTGREVEKPRFFWTYLPIMALFQLWRNLSGRKTPAVFMVLLWIIYVTVSVWWPSLLFPGKEFQLAGVGLNLNVGSVSSSPLK